MLEVNGEPSSKPRLITKEIPYPLPNKVKTQLKILNNLPSPSQQLAALNSSIQNILSIS